MLSRQFYSEADIRKHQIDTLKIFNDNVVEIKESSEYRIDFTASGNNMSLEVILGPEFPHEKPVILINPVVNHPWIAENTNMVVGAPGLINFTVHSDLGRVVQAIIREFSRSQFSAEQNTNGRLSTMSPISTSSMSFPELNNMSIEELQKLLENTDLQDRYLGMNPQLVQLDRATEELMESIENIAKDNLSKQESFDNIKTEIFDRISLISQLKSDFEELSKKHQKLSETFDPHKIRDSLQEAATEADEEAEALAEQFLSGSIPVEVFVNQYVEKRALAQSRRTRGERLAHQLEQFNRSSY